MLSRRPRAIRGDSPDSIAFDSGHDSVMSDAPAGPNSERTSSDSEDEDIAEEDEIKSEPGSPSAPADDAVSISFGALARAQVSLLGRKRKRPSSDPLVPHPRSRLSADTNDHTSEALERKAGKKDDRKHTRLSKHAPTELSSKKAVSRTRSVVPVPKREVRDPRFESISGPINEQKLKSNYAFLDSYRDDEIKELKVTMRKTKDEDAKDKLKWEILRIESKKKAQERKDAEQEVLRRHRKEERAKVEGGKKPFYLKSSEVKKEALVERYKGMRGKEVDKVVERRRRKKAGREKRSMPGERRVGAG